MTTVSANDRSASVARPPAPWAAAAPPADNMLMAAAHQMLRSIPGSNQRGSDAGATPGVRLLSSETDSATQADPDTSTDIAEPSVLSTAAGRTERAADLRAATQANGAKAGADFNPLDPETMTPMQTLLLDTVQSISPDDLSADPALLASVQAAFQTPGGRQLALAANIVDAQLVGNLSQPPGAHGRSLVEVNVPALVDSTYVFGMRANPAQAAAVREQLIAVAENSPTFRNIMERAQQTADGPVTVTTDRRQAAEAEISLDGETITLQSFADPQEAASFVIFETSNAGIVGEAAEVLQGPALASGKFLPGYNARLDTQSAQILSGKLANDPAALTLFVQERITQPDVQKRIDDTVAARLVRQPEADPALVRADVIAKESARLERSATTLPYTLKPYLQQKYGTEEVRLATHQAMLVENIETNSFFNHRAVFNEVRAQQGAGTLAEGTEAALTPEIVKEMDRFRSYGGNDTVARDLVLRTQARTGHTYRYFEDALQNTGSAGLAVISAADPEAVAAAQTQARDTASQSGASARTAIDEAVETHGAANPAAVRTAAETALAAESTTAAEKILANPQVQAAFKASGKVLTAVAAAALVAQLAVAIREDVKAGDQTGSATRQVLAQIVGGVAGAEIGAAVGASAGASAGGALGSVLPVVGTAAGAVVGAAVGGFIGGLLGFGAGSYAAGQAEDKVQGLIDGLIAQQQPAPNQGVLGNLLAEPERNGQRLITAGSGDDAMVNAGELRNALDTFRYTGGASEAELGRMVDAYSSAGNGALSATDLAAAIRDKALVVNADGSVSVDPYQYSINIGSGDGAQAAQAGHIAQRLINLSIGSDGKDDRRINSGELTDSLDAAGYQLADGTDGDLLGRVLNAYDREGDGAVGQQDLTNALLDGAIVIDTDGSVSVNDSRILGQSGGQSANIALRIINAGSSNDAWANHSELDDGFKAAGYDSQLSQDDRDALIARYGKPGVGAVDAAGLRRAIDDGALVFASGGTVSYQA